MVVVKYTNFLNTLFMHMKYRVIQKEEAQSVVSNDSNLLMKMIVGNTV
jgi:hypothetical protein